MRDIQATPLPSIDAADECRELTEWATTRHGNFSQTPI
jgi:hypothetical protein